MQLDTKVAAHGKWRGILAAYGLTEKQLSGRHTECPVCGGKDRFRFDDRNGAGDFYCNACGAGDGFALVMRLRGIGFGDALRDVASLVGQVSTVEPKPSKSPDKIKANLRAMMSGATRTVINPYLASRGITVAPEVWYHPALQYFQGGVRSTHPAMLGVLQDASGAMVAIHRTYLTPAGNKANIDTPKKLTQAIAPISGGAIRLFPADRCLGIAEGIETACAAFQLFGIPTWAAFSAGNMEKFVIPEGVERLVIFGDNDLNGVGQQAADKLRKRYAGIAEVRIPEKIDADWADMLK
jgi:putative DNA primase/helicase